MSGEISPRANISSETKIGDGCKIFLSVCIEGGVVVGDNCITFPSVSTSSDTRVSNGNKIHQGSVFTASPQDFGFVDEKSGPIIGGNNITQENVVINRVIHRDCKTVPGSNNLLMEGAHISHDTVAGDHCVSGYGIKVAGDCNIGTDALTSSNVVERANIRAGEYAMIQAGTAFSKDAPPCIIAGGSSAGYHDINTTINKIAGVGDRVFKHTADACYLLLHGQTSIFDAYIQIEQQVSDSSEACNILEFVCGVEEGIISKL